MTRVLPTKLVLSNRYRTGSPQVRERMADEINDGIFNNLLGMYKNHDSVRVKELRIRYNKLIPEKKKIDILPVRGMFDYSGRFNGHFNKRKNICRYSIELIAKNRFLDVEYLPVLMHESFHYLDYMLNPKYIRSNENCLKSRLNKSVEDLYGRFYYKQNYRNFFGKISLFAKIKKATEMTLSNATNKEKIDILNYLRYHLMLERHAYNREIKYINKLAGMDKPYLDFDIEDINAYMFDEKIRLLKKMLAKIIREERKNLAKQFS